jgi:hypothetical protein
MKVRREKTKKNPDIGHWMFSINKDWNFQFHRIYPYERKCKTFFLFHIEIKSSGIKDIPPREKNPKQQKTNTSISLQ